MVRLSAVIILACAFGIACQPIKTRQEAFQEVIASWQGAHKDELIAQLGPPTRESKLSDGSTVMVWEETITRYRRGSVPENPGQYYYQKCTYVYRADGNGIIRDGSLRGC
jgi:hypothetical protein